MESTTNDGALLKTSPRVAQLYSKVGGQRKREDSEGAREHKGGDSTPRDSSESWAARFDGVEREGARGFGSSSSVLSSQRGTVVGSATIEHRVPAQMNPLLTDYVKLRYAQDLDDEPPIWGLLERDVARHPKANAGITCNEDLVDFVAIFFGPKVVAGVRRTLRVAGNSWLGASYCRRGTFATYADSLINDISARVEKENDAGGQGLAATLQKEKYTVEQRGIADRLKKEKDVGERGIPKDADDGPWETVKSHAEQKRDKYARYREKRERETGRKREEESSQRDGGGSGGGGSGEGGQRGDGAGEGDGQRDPPGAYGDGYNGRQKFIDATVYTVDLPWWSEPGKNDQGRSGDIQVRSLNFVQHAKIKRFARPACRYDPSRSTVQQPAYALLYHGTRWSQIQQFCLGGILPTRRNTEFAIDPAFYVTNNIRTAYEHPVHRGAVDDEEDPIAILCFKVPVPPLRGEAATELGNIFSTRIFDTSSPDRENTGKKILQAFYKHNFQKPRPKNPGAYEERSVITGPISLGKDAVSGDYEILFRDGTYPQQVAFTTRESREWLAHFLFCIYREVYV